jgi:hypothetical protein
VWTVRPSCQAMLLLSRLSAAKTFTVLEIVTGRA